MVGVEKIAEFNKELEEKEKTIEWEEPISLDIITVPEIKPEVLYYGYLIDVSKTISEFTQTPVGMAVMDILGALAASLQKKAEVMVKIGYVERLNLFIIVFMGPGNRKTAVYKLVNGPIYEFEDKEQEAVAIEIMNEAKEKELKEGRMKHLENKAKKEDDPDERQKLIDEIKNINEELENLKIRKTPRLIIDDATPESVNKIMSENNGRAYVSSDEGKQIKNYMGYYSGNSNLSSMNKAYDGQKITEDRIGRDSVIIKNPSLTMSLAVQPSIFEEMENKSSAIGQGFIGRVIPLIPESMIGTRKTGREVPELNQSAILRYKKNLAALLELRPKEITKDGEWIPYTINLSEGTKDLLYSFEEEIEQRMAEGNDLEHLRDWASKLIGKTIRIAGLLHIAGSIEETKDLSLICQKKIPKDLMKSVIELSRQLIPHAKKMYSILQTNPEQELTEYVLRRIVKGKEMEDDGKLEDRFKKNKLDRAVLYQLVMDKNDIKKPDDLEKPLKLLEDLNYIKMIKQPNKGPGRPPAPIIKLNPKLDHINNINHINSNNKNGLYGLNGVDNELENDLIEGEL